MADILKTILEKLPPNSVSSIYFEGSNIIAYTSNKEFFLGGEEKIREIVNEIKKRIELRASKELLLEQEKCEEIIRERVPKEAGLEGIHFDEARSIVILDCLNPTPLVENNAELLKKIKKEIFWKPEIRRIAMIRSKISEGITNIIYKSSAYRKKFLNGIGKKIYREWGEKKEKVTWARVTFLGGARQVGRSCLLLHTPDSRVLLDCGIDLASETEKFPILNVPEFNIKEIDAIIVTHSHLDHSGLVPYLYKIGYRGPTYMTAPTRDTTALLALDFIGVTYKQATKPLFSISDIKTMIKHSIALDYNEVTDITSDLRLTFYRSGHSLGSAMAHINIANGLHNLLYTSDFKYAKTKLFDPAVTKFARLESLIMEATYGGREDRQPSRAESEARLIEGIKRTIERKGKVLIPVLGVGRSQDVMLIIKEAIEAGTLPKVPVYIDGMVWDITAIHTAYPEFLGFSLRSKVYSGENIFSSEVFKKVGSPNERREVIEGGPCIIIATSGMLVGGASLEYFKELASSKVNTIIFTSYQSAGSLGRKVKEGLTEFKAEIDGEERTIPIALERLSIEGLSGHSDRSQLVSFVSSLQPQPKRIILQHGELNKIKDLTSTLHKLFKVETIAPNLLDSIRIV
ncbi:MAG: beta-CASP ribonuclease aCPSF1 [Candidatus Pacearchaeota archaeon]